MRYAWVIGAATGVAVLVGTNDVPTALITVFCVTLGLSFVNRKSLPPPIGFHSWYIAPCTETRTYLYRVGDMWQYTPFIRQAHLFTTEQEAWAVTPTYDGSADIENRAGIVAVFGGQ